MPICLKRPYFVGQQSSPCGHFYPDVLRMHDKRHGKSFVRVLNCVRCGDYDVPIDAATADLKNRTEMSQEQLDALRERERIRVRKRIGAAQSNQTRRRRIRHVEVD